MFDGTDGDNKKRPNSKLGLILGGVTGISAIALLGLSYPFVVPAFRKICLPYLPATDVQVINVMKLLNKVGGRNVIDLGSGDGRIVSIKKKPSTPIIIINYFNIRIRYLE